MPAVGIPPENEIHLDPTKDIQSALTDGLQEHVKPGQSTVLYVSGYEGKTKCIECVTMERQDAAVLVAHGQHIQHVAVDLSKLNDALKALGGAADSDGNVILGDNNGVQGEVSIGSQVGTPLMVSLSRDAQGVLHVNDALLGVRSSAVLDAWLKKQEAGTQARYETKDTPSLAGAVCSTTPNTACKVDASFKLPS